MRPVLIGILFIAGCSGASPRTACSVLSDADVAAALGEAVGKPTDQMVTKGDGNSPTSSVCQFKTKVPVKTPKSVSLMLREPRPANESADQIAQQMQKTGYKNVRTIAGVGDQAVWAATTVEHRFTGILTVIKGKSVLAITVIGFADESVSLDKAKKITMKVVTKI